MKRKLSAAAIVITSLPAAVTPAVADSSTGFTELSNTMAIYSADEFDGPTGSAPNPAMWNVERGGGGWGNGEQQVYTAESANLRLDGGGNLVIQALEEGGAITSARINTRGKADLASGMVAARIKLPAGAGLHPAFWMLGTSLETAGYPECGEIDTIETIDATPRGYFTLHGPKTSSTPEKREHWQAGVSADVPDLFDRFHIFWVEKRPGRVIMGIDETPTATFTPDTVPPDAVWVMDDPYFAVLNLAVGGVWPGPLGPGVLPQKMLVDWVRFYR